MCCYNNQIKGMAVLLSFLILTILILSQSQKTEALKGAMARDCQRKCGHVEIPYPFGMKNKSCYLDEAFEVTCNESTGTVSLPWIDVEVDNISFSSHSLRVKTFRVLALPFNKSGENPGGHSFSLMMQNRFFLSGTKNKFVAMGCDFYAYLIDAQTKHYVGGCTTLCNRTDIVPSPSSSCSGLQCCQINLPEHLRRLVVWIDTMNTERKAWAGRCGFLAFVDKDFHLNKTMFADCNETYLVPVIMEWTVGNTSCTEARGRENYACGLNTKCMDKAYQGKAYRCSCSNGYHGNPYLPEGCQDINECESNPCHPKAICINRTGSYKCTCPPDYFGDGTVLGTGCISVSAPTKTVLFAGLLAALGLILLLGFSYFLYKRLKKRTKQQLKRKHFKRNGGLLLLQQQTAHDSVLDKMRVFTSKELEKATDQFNHSRILGQGGQGTVYKGMLSDGRIVAVKKSKQVNEGQLAEFINEVVILAQVNHRNVVRLLGCCLETEVPLLVYEFIPNGTLYDLIHDDSSGFPFTWDLRLRIASEIANALAYLHYATPVPIYHRDMKSNNIMLDDKYKAKLSDFGISRLVAIDQTHLTTKVKGTFGYLDPEYFRTSKFTGKSDVYGFGVVLAELLTGQKAVSTGETEEEEEEEERSLVMKFLLAMEENRLGTILDSKIAGQGVSEEHIGVAKLAKRCLSLSGKKRPTARQVASELEKIRTHTSETSSVDTSNEINSCVSSAEVYQWAHTFVHGATE